MRAQTPRSRRIALGQTGACLGVVVRTFLFSLGLYREDDTASQGCQRPERHTERNYIRVLLLQIVMLQDNLE